MTQSTADDAVGTSPRTLDPRPLHGLLARDSAGAVIGTVAAVYSDVELGLAEWAAVRLGRLGRHEVLVPLADALVVGADLRLGYARSLVDAAPHRDPGRRLSIRVEEELFEHYGIPYAGDTVTAATEERVLDDELDELDELDDEYEVDAEAAYAQGWDYDEVTGQWHR